jgi:hypothetical protein
MADRPPQSPSSSGSSAPTGQRMKAEVKAEAEARKGDAAGQVDEIASAMDRAAEELQHNPTLSRYAEDLASSMHGIAGRLRDRSVDDLAEELRQLARRNPTLLVLGSLGAGLALARFMKASPQREHGNRAVDRTDETWPAGTSAAPYDPLTGTAGIGPADPAFVAPPTNPLGRPGPAAPNTDTRRA